MNYNYSFFGYTKDQLCDTPWCELKTRDDYVRFHTRLMLTKTQSMFEWKGLPEQIPQRDLELLIQTHGFSTIASEQDKIWSLIGRLGGLPNGNYMPTISIVANPYLKIDKEYTIDKDCIIITNDSMYMGLTPLCTYFAYQMTDNDISLKRVRINTRALFALLCDNDSAKESAELFLKRLEDGESGGVLLDKKAFEEMIQVLPLSAQGTAQNIIQLLEDKQYIKGSWLNELGVQSNYNMKRETITANENILNVDGLLPLCDDMLKCRKLGCEKVNKMFGTNWSVDFSSAWKKLRKEIELSEQRDFGTDEKSKHLDNEETEETKTEEKDGEENGSV